MVDSSASEQPSVEAQAQAETPLPAITPTPDATQTPEPTAAETVEVQATPTQERADEAPTETGERTIPVENEYLFYALDETAAAALCGQYGGALLRWSDGLGVMYREAFDQFEGIFYPQELYIVSSAPYVAQPGETATNIAAAQRLSANQGAGVVIAVIDSGVDLDHPALAGGIADAISVIPDSAYGDSGYFDADYLGAQDYAGHGSHIAGILVGQTDEMTLGVAPGAQVLSIKALEKYGYSAAGTTEWMIRAILYAISQQVDIINLSIGGGKSYVPAAQTALKQAADAGILVVCATGNSFVGPTEGIDYPAAYENALAVTSVTVDGKRVSISDFSRYGAGTDISAPGVEIYSCNASGQYQTLSGTSMSCAIVSGIAALLMSENPDFTPADVTRLLKQSARDEGSVGYDTIFGWGVVDAKAALLLLKKGVDSTGAHGTVDEAQKPARPGDPTANAEDDWLQTQLREQNQQEAENSAVNTLQPPQNAHFLPIYLALIAAGLALVGVWIARSHREKKRAAR